MTSQEKVRFAREQSVDPEAFAAYSLGIHLWNRFNPTDLDRAIAYLEEAITLEPTNALYHAGLAQALLLAGSPHGGLTPDKAWPRAKEAALTAVELDQSLADGYAALGWILSFYDNSPAEAHHAFRRALALNPSSAFAHWGLGELLGREFRPEEALAELRLAQRLDPLTPIYSGDVAVQLYFLRRYDEAIVEATRSVELDPNFAPSLWILSEALLAMGLHDEAVTAHERAASISPAFNVFLVHTYVTVGRHADAERLFREGRDSWGRIGSYAIGVAYAALGQEDSALTWLEAAYESGDPYVHTIRFMPHFDGIRDTPRFSRLVAKLDSAAWRDTLAN